MLNCLNTKNIKTLDDLKVGDYFQFHNLSEYVWGIFYPELVNTTLKVSESSEEFYRKLDKWYGNVRVYNPYNKKTYVFVKSIKVIPLANMSKKEEANNKLPYTHLLYARHRQDGVDGAKESSCLYIIGTNTKDIFHTMGEYVFQNNETLEKIDQVECTQERLDYWKSRGFEINEFKNDIQNGISKEVGDK